MLISPYLYEGVWVFDDDRFDIVREPFVLGIPEMLDKMVKDLYDPENGFLLFFSSQPFPNYQVCMHRLYSEMNGNYYQLEGTEMVGWLCPTLYTYFEVAPERIYIKVDSRKRGQ